MLNKSDIEFTKYSALIFLIFLITYAKRAKELKENIIKNTTDNVEEAVGNVREYR